MSYAKRFRRRQYIKGSLWIAPVLGLAAAGILAEAVSSAERSVTLPETLQFSSSTASSFLGILAGASISLIGFVVTVTVLVVQIATANLTPRSMRLWYRDPMLKTVLAVLAGTFMFSFAQLRRITPDQVPNLGVICAGCGQAAAIIVFLLFLDRFIHRLRPVKVAEIVAEEAKRIVAGSPAFQRQASETGEVAPPATEPSAVVRPDASGVIQAVDEVGLVSWATEHECLVVLPIAIGDAISEDDVIAEVHGGPVLDAERRLGGMIAIGVERTIDQDPGFALRLMADVAIRALSPAVNDPTTAVQVLSRIADLLRCIGKTYLRAPARLLDEHGEIRVLLRAPGWEDYLAMGVTEIRECGADSIQVVRAMRKHLEDLHREVLPPYRAGVEEEMRRLEAGVKLSFAGSPDLDRARESDAQGLGGLPSREATA